MTSIALESCADSTPPRSFRRVATSPPLPIDFATAAEMDCWFKASRKLLEQELAGRAIGAYHPGHFLVWRIYGMGSQLEQASIIDGSWNVEAQSEAERCNISVFVFKVLDRVDLTLSSVNAYPRAVEVLELGRPGITYVILFGANWRAGTELSLVEWNLKSGNAELLLQVGGEEEAEILSYDLSFAEDVTLVIRGIRAEKHVTLSSRIKDIERRIGLRMQIR